MFMSGILQFVPAFRNNPSWVAIRSLFLFSILMLMCGQVNAASTLTISTPTSDGRFTVTWSGSSSIVMLREGFVAPGSSVVWSAPQEKPPTGSIDFHKTQPGTYVYTFTDCQRDRGILTCSTGATGDDVVIGIPSPTVTATFSPTTINEGSTATLTWSSTNATGCTATGIAGVSGASGSVTYQAPTVMSANQTVTIPVKCFNGGTNTTANATLVMQWVNDAPTLSAITNRTINEDSSTGSIAFTVNDEETAAGSLVVTASSGNLNLIPNSNLVLGGSGANRTIIVTPKANAHGSATITVTVADAHGKSTQRTFTVTVNPVNDAPTISAIASITIDENQATGARSFTVADTEMSTDSLSVTATSSNIALIPNNNIVLGGSGGARTISVTPLSNKNGSATITVTVSDGQLSTNRSFVLTVRDVLAKFTAIPETSSTGVYTVSWSSAREYAVLTERIYRSGTIIYNDPVEVGTSGSRSYTQTENGTYVYILQDCYRLGGPPNGNPVCEHGETRAVEVTFPAPSVSASISPATINEGGTATLTWNSANSTSCSATGISGVSSTSGNVTYTGPSLMSSNQSLSIPVTCGRGATTATATATVNVNWVNDTPVISTITDRTINEDTSTGAIAFTVADEETPPGSLVVTATSSNTSLIPNGNLVLGGSGATRIVAVVPAANAHGSAIVTVKVTDAHGGSAQHAFTVTVNPVNDAPNIPAISNITIDENQDTGVRSFTIGDIDTAAGSLTVTATSNNTALVPNNNIVLGGSGSSRTIKVIPLQNKTGSATITVTVSDGALTANGSFTVTVNNLPIKFDSITETTSTGVVNMSWSKASHFVQLAERLATDGTWTLLRDNAPASGSHSVTKFRNGTYYYRVLDCYYAGGPPNGNLTCPEGDVRVVNVALAIPDVPALTVAANNTGNYSISWSTTSRTVRYELQENNTNADNGGNLLFQAKNYSNKSTGVYDYKVRACNDTGCSPFSATQTLKVANPGAITAVNATINSATGIASLSSTIHGAPTHYEVQARINAGAWGATRTFTTPSFNMPAVNVAGTYSYQVRACATADSYTACSSWVLSNNVSLQKPITPALTVPLNSSTGDYQISWTSVANAATYVLSENMLDVIPAFTTQNVFHPPVKANGSYSYTIRACNATGCSAPSAMKKIDVAKVGNVSSITATLDPVTGRPSVNWAAVPGANYYKISVADGYSEPVFIKTVTTTSTLLEQINPLGGRFSYHIQACSEVGSFINCSSLGYRSNPVSLPAPDATTIVSPSLSTSGEYIVSWLSTPHASRYELYENGARIQNTASTFKSFTGANRKGNGSYTYKVIACTPLICAGPSNIRDTTVQRTSGSSSSASSSSFSSVPGSSPGGNSSSSVPSNPELVSKYVNSPPIMDEPQGPLFVGSLKGEFKVNESGAATYTVAIATADGVAGVKPQLSIAYNSQAGNGLLGKGWSINGLGSISRCRQTVSQDNVAKPLTWTAQDRFCFNGQRLMLSDGIYGDVGATYRTEIESFVTVTSVGGTAGHPDYFEVTAKDGSTTTYGAAGNSNSEVSGRNANGNIVANRILTWNISKFEDSIGNPIFYQYDSGSNYHYLREIQYAYGLSKAESSYGARIVFQYKDRTDFLGGYVGGYFIGNNKLLEKVSTYSEGKLLRNYHLFYEQTPFSQGNDNRIYSIQECVEDSYCYPSTFFEWNKPAPGNPNLNGFDQTLGGFVRTAGAAKVMGFTFLDINGNGLLDYVWAELRDGSDYFSIRYALDNAVVNRTQDNSKGLDVVDKGAAPKFMPIDYNADGRQDLMIYKQEYKKWSLYLATPDANGWRLSASSVTLPFTSEHIQLGDINSDGLVDVAEMRDDGTFRVHVLGLDTTVVTSNKRYKYLQSTSYSIPSPPGISGGDIETDKEKFRMADFNGDGQVDLFVQHNITTCMRGVICTVTDFSSSIYLWNGSSFVFHANVGIQGKENDSVIVTDINNDGNVDIAVKVDDGWYFSLNTGAGFLSTKYIPGRNGEEIKTEDISIVDLNRDGYGDFVGRNNTDAGTPLFVKYWNPHISDFDDAQYLRSVPSPNQSYFFMDTNGDSWVDLANFSPNNNGSGLWIYGSSDANYYIPLPGQTPIGKPDLIAEIIDGLGNKTKIVYEPLGRSPNYLPVGEVKVWDETVMNCGAVSYSSAGCRQVTNTLIDSSDFYTKVNAPFDYSNSYAADLPDQPDNSYLLNAPVLEITGPLPVVTRVESTAPAANDQPGNIAANAMSAIDYEYQHARMQAKGRGMLGFGVVASIDQQTGIRTETKYRQDWPYTGSPLSTTIKTADGKLLSESINVWDVKAFGSLGKRRFHPRVTKTIDRSYTLDSDGTVSASPSQTITTDTVMVDEIATDDENGNVDSITVITAGNGLSLVKKTKNIYFDGAWEKAMGRLKSSTVTTQRISDAGTEDDSSRIAYFEYYTNGVQKGLLHKEFIEKGTAEELETTYVYDGWGNKTRVSVKGKVNSTRVETRTTTTAYDSNGRFVVSTTNDLDQSSQVTGRNKFGIPSSGADINGVSSQTFHNPMGEKYLHVDATGAWTRNDVLFCGASISGVNINCGFSSATKYFSLTRVAGGGASIEYFDSLGRVIRSGKIGFDGRWVYADTEYDNLTRIKHQSLPYFEGESPAGWTTNYYDNLGRITKTVSPDTSESIINYVGNEATATNSLGQKLKQIRNGLNQLVRVEDNIGGTVAYEYNLKGDLLTATTDDAPDASPNYAPITVRICYDHLGRKIAMHDPDKGGFKTSGTPSCASATTQAGWWKYQYNAFGELISQTDPKGQSSTLEYDKLGRMIRRTDKLSGSVIDAHTRWFYDTGMDGSPQTGAKGQVTAVVMSKDGSETCVGANHCTVNAYDENARPINTLVMLPDDTTGYMSKIDYDTIGRVYEQHDVLEGAVFSESGTQTQYNQYGYAYRIVDIKPLDGSNGVLNTIREMDAQGKVTEELRGNGAITTTSYYPQTGLLKSQRATISGLSNIQDNLYVWDEVGNLKSRATQSAVVGSASNKNKGEAFCYDGLNRLVATSPTATSNCAGAAAQITYDGFGNIRSKAGVGTYAYSNANAGPHAVTSVGGNPYTYDANGNVISGDGRTFEFTSYDMAKKISKDINNFAEFRYGPDRARWQRIDKKGSLTTTTTYLGNVERISRSDSTMVEWKRNAGGVIFTYKTQNNQLVTNGSDKKYTYLDHLGSVDAITDTVGKVTHTLSFDAWGARRSGSDWNAISSTDMANSLKLASFQQPVTTRGYTGHEMADDMGIIHMNGRIYDARIGRFLQADPFIQAAANTQSYNRYSYVFNNPLNATDPSGYFSLKKLWDKVRPYVSMIVAVVLSVVLCEGSCTMEMYALIGGISGAAGAAANGGNVIQGALTGAVSAAVFYGIGSKFKVDMMKGGSNFWEAGVRGGARHIFVHAVAGGTLAVLQGGKFGHGFAAAGLSKGFDANFNMEGSGPSAFIGETVIVAVVGGTISEMTGGKFANGANTAAFQHLFNEATSQKLGCGGRGKICKSRAPGKIYITGHRVGDAGPFHTAIEYDDGTGTQWISAGPEGELSLEGFEDLVGGVGNTTNGVRPTDAPALNVILGEVTPPAGMAADEYFDVLATAARNYTNHVDYDMFPGVSDSYNSNSYVAGLLGATGGISSVDMSSFVGGSKPLPKKHFGY